jgi:hypothetical protein
MSSDTLELPISLELFAEEEVPLFSTDLFGTPVFGDGIVIVPPSDTPIQSSNSQPSFVDDDIESES